MMISPGNSRAVSLNCLRLSFLQHPRHLGLLDPRTEESDCQKEIEEPKHGASGCRLGVCQRVNRPEGVVQSRGSLEGHSQANGLAKKAEHIRRARKRILSHPASTDLGPPAAVADRGN